MRNLISITAAVTVILLAALLFSSCSINNSGETAETSATEWSSAEAFTLDDDVASSAEIAESDEKNSNERAKEIISEALDAYSLFISTAPEIDRGDSIEYEEGLYYYRVTDKRLNTIEKLRDYMLGFFSEDIVNQLLNVERYMAFDDGSLYVLDINMSTGANIISEAFSVGKQSSKKETYSVTVVKDNDENGAADATETYEFVREPTKEDSDKWVFTKFTYYR